MDIKEYKEYEKFVDTDFQIYINNINLPNYFENYKYKDTLNVYKGVLNDIKQIGKTNIDKLKEQIQDNTYIRIMSWDINQFKGIYDIESKLISIQNPIYYTMWIKHIKPNIVLFQEYIPYPSIILDSNIENKYNVDFNYVDSHMQISNSIKINNNLEDNIFVGKAIYSDISINYYGAKYLEDTTILFACYNLLNKLIIIINVKKRSEHNFDKYLQNLIIIQDILTLYYNTKYVIIMGNFNSDIINKKDILSKQNLILLDHKEITAIISNEFNNDFDFKFYNYIDIKEVLYSPIFLDFKFKNIIIINNKVYSYLKLFASLCNDSQYKITDSTIYGWGSNDIMNISGNNNLNIICDKPDEVLSTTKHIFFSYFQWVWDIFDTFVHSLGYERSEWHIINNKDNKDTTELRYVFIDDKDNETPYTFINLINYKYEYEYVNPRLIIPIIRKINNIEYYLIDKTFLIGIEPNDISFEHILYRFINCVYEISYFISSKSIYISLSDIRNEPEPDIPLNYFKYDKRKISLLYSIYKQTCGELKELAIHFPGYEGELYKEINTNLIKKYINKELDITHEFDINFIDEIKCIKQGHLFKLYRFCDLSFALTVNNDIKNLPYTILQPGMIMQIPSFLSTAYSNYGYTYFSKDIKARINRIPTAYLMEIRCNTFKNLVFTTNQWEREVIIKHGGYLKVLELKSTFIARLQSDVRTITPYNMIIVEYLPNIAHLHNIDEKIGGNNSIILDPFIDSKLYSVLLEEQLINSINITDTNPVRSPITNYSQQINKIISPTKGGKLTDIYCCIFIIILIIILYLFIKLNISISSLWL